MGLGALAACLSARRGRLTNTPLLLEPPRLLCLPSQWRERRRSPTRQSGSGVVALRAHVGRGGGDRVVAPSEAARQSGSGVVALRAHVEATRFVRLTVWLAICAPRAIDASRSGGLGRVACWPVWLAVCAGLWPLLGLLFGLADSARHLVSCLQSVVCLQGLLYLVE